MHKDGFVCMPLRSGSGGGRAYLLVGIDAGDWPWIRRQTRLLKTIATAVAVALEREQRNLNLRNDEAANRAALAASKTKKIVHEINNPLSIIKNYLKVLTLRTDEDPSGKDELRIIGEEINRVTGLLKSLRSPSENTPFQLEPVNVNDTITDILGLFRDSLPVTAPIRLNQDLDVNIPVITSDRNRLKQALINLLKNAMEAMPEGGTIQVTTRMLSSPSRRVAGKTAAGRVKISICDDGPGIDGGIKNDIFKSSVTSKTGHDGLGLFIVHETVTHLKGSILCESAPGRGTCFHIELPADKNGSKDAHTTD
jgi:signal transduction histidine kinase